MGDAYGRVTVAAVQAAPEVLCRGGRAIVAPDGRHLAGPRLLLTAPFQATPASGARFTRA